MSCQLEIQDLGKMAYEPALALQRSIQQQVISYRNTDEASPFHLLFVEHDPPVVTVSRRATATQESIYLQPKMNSKRMVFNYVKQIGVEILPITVPVNLWGIQYLI